MLRTTRTVTDASPRSATAPFPERTLAVEYMRPDEPEPMTGRAMRVSLGGLFIETMTHMAVGEDLVVRLPIPDRIQWILVPGTVRWTNPSGMGVQFGLLRARETHAILEIERLLSADPTARKPPVL